MVPVEAVGRGEAGEAAAVLFGRIDSQRSSEAVATRIRFLIRSKRLVVGDRLPPERELCELFGVSRVTLREALRILETNGLIEVKVGVRGGAVVTVPSVDVVGEGMSDLLSLSALSAAEITEARALVELGLVPLVCERATESDLRALDDLCDVAYAERSRGEYDVRASLAFHLQVAAATHNPAIELLLTSFERPILKSLYEACHSGTRGIEEHRQFVAAVRDRDVERAVDVMRHHLSRTAERVAPN